MYDEFIEEWQTFIEEDRIEINGTLIDVYMKTFSDLEKIRSLR